MHARSIAREDRTPYAYAYSNQRHDHRRLISRPSSPVTAIDGIKGVEIHRRHRLDHEPREVILRQPLPHIRRHQERLLAITRDKARTHTGILVNAPDDPTYATAPDDPGTPAMVRRQGLDAGRAVVGDRALTPHCTMRAISGAGSVAGARADGGVPLWVRLDPSEGGTRLRLSADHET